MGVEKEGRLSAGAHRDIRAQAWSVENIAATGDVQAN